MDMCSWKDLDSCRSKAKELRSNYKLVKEENNHPGHTGTSMPLFSILDQFLDNGAAVYHMSGPQHEQRTLKNVQSFSGGQIMRKWS